MVGRLAASGVLVVILIQAAVARSEPAAWDRVPGALRLKATFETTPLQADSSAGEPRMTRVYVPGWAGSDFKDRLRWKGCLVEGRHAGRAFRPLTDAAFRAVGNMNADRGTFAAWLKRSKVFDQGGMLFSARSFVCGAPRAVAHWALGIRPAKSDKPEKRRLFVQTGGGVTEAPLPAAGEWLHVAAVWDAEHGAKLYVDGALQASSWGQKPWVAQQAPVARFQFESHEDPSAVDDLLVFDTALTDRAVARLAQGEIVLDEEPERVDRALRMTGMGWGESLDGDLIDVRPGRPLVARLIPIERAYDDFRAAGHLGCDGILESLWPWWYHGYQFVHPRKLHLMFARPERFNYVVVRGDLEGRLHDGGSPQEPLSGREILRLKSAPAVERKRLAVAAQGTSATLLRDSREGRLAEIQLCEVTQGEPPPGQRTAAYHLCGAPGAALPLSALKHDELITRYRPAERSYLVGRPAPGTRTEARRMEALTSYHLLTPAAQADLPLSAVRLRLWLDGLQGPARLGVVVHDAFDLWREWARLDFRLQPAKQGPTPVDVTLDLRDTLVRRGDALWLTLVLDQATDLVYRPGQAESQLLLDQADPTLAEKQWMEWELATWRDGFESLSEPRPWSKVSDAYESCWWLVGCSPDYEHMHRVGGELFKRFPAEPRVRAWFQFIHPQMPNPAQNLAIPGPGPHPEWAFLAKECYQRLHHFADWWSRRRAAPNGELGHFYGDDTDLLQDWPDIAMISDPEGLLARTVRKVADGVWSEWKLSDGRPLHVNGLNTRFKDGLHAYEEGINIQPLAALLDYGHPLLVERLLATCARYDGFLFEKEQDGRRAFAGSWWGTDPKTPPTHSPDDHYAFLFCHPGLMAIWYNGHPEALKILSQAADWKRARWAGQERPDVGYGGRFFFTGLYLNSSKAEYLAPLLPELGQTGVCLDPTLCAVLPAKMWDPAATLAALQADRDTRYDELGTTRLGFTDDRYEKGYLEWQITRDKQHLVRALRRLYQRLEFTMPALTVAEQSGDRVSPPKGLVSRMYLGGTPAGRMYLYPIFAASYVGLNTNYAALVLENQPDRLKVLFYNFDPQPQRGAIRVWGVEPGLYRVRTGLDADGDDDLDAAASQAEKQLWRGAETAIELPARKAWIWEARQIRPASPLRQRPDVAVTAEDAAWSPDGVLTVRVHNIGCTAVRNLTVELKAADGRSLGRKIVDLLDPPLDFQPRLAEVQFRPLPPAPRKTILTVELDPDFDLQEITRTNNTTRITSP